MCCGHPDEPAAPGWGAQIAFSPSREMRAGRSARKGRRRRRLFHENISTDSRDDDTQDTTQSGRAESDRKDRIAEEKSESSGDIRLALPLPWADARVAFRRDVRDEAGFAAERFGREVNFGAQIDSS